MKILLTHVDFIEYKPERKEIEIAEDVPQITQKIENAVVAFTAVEREDNEEKVHIAVEEIKKSIKNLGVKRVVLYPFAHLSNNLKRPKEALVLLKLLERKLRENDLETFRAPFGWCKSLHIKVKGHPLAEQLKVI